MMRVLRKHRDWLMIVIAILAIPFVFYFVQKPDYGAMGRDQFATVYGRTISNTQAQHQVRLLGLANALGMTTFVQDLTGGAPIEQNEARVAFVFNSLIVRHEAEQMGIQPTKDEVVDLIRSLPAFRGPNGFDPKKYEEFTNSALGPNGMTESEIEDVARDELCLNRIKRLLDVGISLPEAELKTEFEEYHGKSFASVIRLRNAEFSKDVKVTDDAIKKYYETHKAEFKTDEKRKIEFVRLTLTDEQKKLLGKERVDILQKLQDRALDFTQAMLEKGADFNKVAAKSQVPVETTSEFTPNAPDPKLKDKAKVNGVAFQLNAQDPNSDVIEEEDGYYILHLASVLESHPLTLEEAKPKIIDAIKTEKARELIATRGAKIVHDLRESLKLGVALPKAAEQLGVKLEKAEPFAIADEQVPDTTKPQSMDQFVIKNAAAQLQRGEVGDFSPAPDGGLVVILEKRDPPDPAKYQENKAAFDERYLKSKRAVVFYEWLQDRQRIATGKG
jgi:peptidyl-prolyl cis-trans isomerase D